MIKRSILTVIATFIAWSLIDFVVHGFLLQGAYESTADLWRPMEEMKMGLMYLVTLLYLICFVAIYATCIGEKSICSGMRFGFLFGLAAGISMGFGSYSYMPIPASLAWIWFAGVLVECTIAGLLAGVIIKIPEPATR